MFPPITPPLHLACEQNNLAMIRSLLAHHADPDATDIIGQEAPLHFATSPEAALMLIEAGADIELQNEGGYSPLHYAVLHKHWELARCLIARGANLDAEDWCGITPRQRIPAKIARKIIPRPIHQDATPAPPLAKILQFGRR